MEVPLQQSQLPSEPKGPQVPPTHQACFVEGNITNAKLRVALRPKS